MLRIFAEGDVPLLGVALFALGVLGFVLTRNSRAESQRQFDADAALARPSRPAASAAPA